MRFLSVNPIYLFLQVGEFLIEGTVLALQIFVGSCEGCNLRQQVLWEGVYARVWVGGGPLRFERSFFRCPDP